MVTITNNDIRTIAFQRRQRPGFTTNGDLGDLTVNDLKLIVAQLLDLQSQITAGGALKKRSYTIGAPGVAGCDYNFTSVANATEQSIQLGAATIIPALSPVPSVVVWCMAGVNDPITASVDVGKTAGTDEYISAVDLDDTNEITSVSQQVVPDVVATSVYFSATPSANWNTVTTWKLQVDVYFFDGTV